MLTIFFFQKMEKYIRFDNFSNKQKMLHFFISLLITIVYNFRKLVEEIV